MFNSDSLCSLMKISTDHQHLEMTGGMLGPYLHLFNYMY